MGSMMKLNDTKKEIIFVALVIIIQTIIFVIAGINKSYIHMDEAYSLGLASYDKLEIQENEDFYNNWHSKDYYKDYLVVNEDEKDNFSQVYENQKNDVHPPLYYFILRVAMGFHIDNYSKWSGIAINIIIYVFITIYMYLIIKKVLQGKNMYKEKSLILALVSSITLEAITNAIYIRMYALSTLNIVITTYLHLKLLDSTQSNYKLYMAIGLVALIGSLTHYYYLFYLAMLFIMFCIKYIKEKNYKELIKYMCTMIVAGLISLVIFPYSIQHMFCGYRGQGVISNLLDVSKFVISISLYLLKINIYTFNNILFIICIMIIGIIIYKKKNKVKIFKEKNKYIKYILFPTLFYFILVAISSPWTELRYVMPVCGLIFILVIYFIVELLSNIMKEQRINKVIIGLFLLMLIMPFLSNQVIKAVYTGDFKIEPEVMYSSKKDIMDKLKNELNVPTIYMFNSNSNRFLDNILLFANIDESYIAKDIDCNEEHIKYIMMNKDISNGIVVFINEGQNNNEILEVIKVSIGLKEIVFLRNLNNCCDIYYIK